MTDKQKLLLISLLVIHYIILFFILNRSLDFLFNDASHRIGPGSDFFALYNAGKNWLLGNGIYMHGPGYGFRYHPILAMTILSYISYFDYNPAYWIWVGINEILFLATLYFIRKLIPEVKYYLIICSLLVFFSPYYLEIYMGNASFIVGTLLLIAFYYYREKKDSKFFSLFIISILIKPIGLLFLPFLLLYRKYKIVILTIIIIFGLALPYFLIHPHDWISFISVNFEGFPAKPGFLVHAGNQGFYALMLMVSAHINNIPNGQLYTLGQLPLWNSILIRAIPYFFVLISLWTTYRLRKSNRVDILIFIWTATYLLGYKDIWEHTHSLLIFGMFFLYCSKQINPKLLFISTAALALPTAFVFYDITFYSGAFNDPGWHWSFPISFVHHLSKPIWVLVLYIIVIVKSQRDLISEISSSSET
ncbi:MAG: glycosyltransferase 87 family protein [Candidatus Zixiibacteriota bacterium]